MTRATALELILRIDIDATLEAAGRKPTLTDVEHHYALIHGEVRRRQRAAAGRASRSRP